MSRSWQLYLDDSPIRFTPGGKMFVLDAIAAVTESDRPAALWKQFRTQQPEVNRYCEYLATSVSGKEPVCNSEGWGVIQDLLFDYMITRKTETAENRC